MSRLTDLSLPLLVKLGSIAVHADEFFSPDGHEYDKTAIVQLLQDPDVQTWLKMMDGSGFLPKKRKA